MTKTEARKVGLELKAKGMTYQQMATELGKRGYRTGQGKEPQWYDINYLLNHRRYAMLTKKRRLTHLRTPRSYSSNDLRTVKEVVFNDKIAADKKVEIIKIVLEAHNKKTQYPIDIGL